jgi:L-ascorbate metabolism protein UlaG (beta-lactamase superfamily)
MKFTYYGHSCFGVEIEGIHLLFDPFISPNALAQSIDLDQIPCDYILLSHGHFDHVADVERIAKRTGAKIIASYELAVHYGNKGLAHHPMNTGGSWDFGTWKVKCVQAVHSSVMADGTYAGSAMGFVIATDHRSFYYSGDTALHLDMKLIAEYYPVDMALLSMGDNFTMGIDDAVIASRFIDCDVIVAMHFDTFPYIVLDREAAQHAFEIHNKQLIIPAIGQSFEL